MSQSLCDNCGVQLPNDTGSYCPQCGEPRPNSIGALRNDLLKRAKAGKLTRDPQEHLKRMANAVQKEKR